MTTAIAELPPPINHLWKRHPSLSIVQICQRKGCSAWRRRKNMAYYEYATAELPTKWDVLVPPCTGERIRNLQKGVEE